MTAGMAPRHVSNTHGIRSCPISERERRRTHLQRNEVDHDYMNDIIRQYIAERLPDCTTTERIEAALWDVAALAEKHVLNSLLTTHDIARQFGVTERRIRALAVSRHAIHGIGWKAPSTCVWFFRPSEVELLRPAPRGRPRKPRT